MCECEWPAACDGLGTLFCLDDECACECGCEKACLGCPECAVDEWPDEDELVDPDEDDD